MTSRPRLLTLRDWPLSVKLASAVLALAVIPLLIVALVDTQLLEAHAIERETANLERRAAAAARRLAERVGRLRAYGELVAQNPTLVAAVPADAGGTAGDTEAERIARAQRWDEAHPGVHPLLVSVRKANPWFSNVYLLDAQGVCIATSERATKPQMIGRPYDYRPYFQAAIEDRGPFVTDVLKNANSPGTAIFVSAPVLVDDVVTAVVVLKVDTAALHEVVADLAQTGGSAALVDRFGVVVSDAWMGSPRDTADPDSLQFHPLASVARFVTLFQQTRRYGNPQGDHHLDRIEQPLALDPLWNALQQRTAGAAEYEVPPSFGHASVATMVGFAPVLAGSSEPYGYVMLGEPAAAFRGPLAQIGRDALLRFFVVAFVVALVIALLIRRFSAQVVDLAETAQQLARGESDRPLPLLDRRDELGVLARSLEGLATRVQTAVSERTEATADHERQRNAAQVEARARTEAIARAHATLRTATEALAASDPGPEGRRALLDRLGAASLDLAALGSRAHLRPQPEPVDLSALLRDLRDARADETAHRPIEVQAPDELSVTTDPAMLRRILEHLLDNACKFTRRGSITLEATLCEDTQRVTVVIRDTGIGLTARQAARFGGERAEPVAAAGIGIPVCQRLASALGAELSATGEVGRGTTVTLDLPSQPPPPKADPAAELTP